MFASLEHAEYAAICNYLNTKITFAQTKRDNSPHNSPQGKKNFMFYDGQVAAYMNILSYFINNRTEQTVDEI